MAPSAIPPQSHTDNSKSEEAILGWVAEAVQESDAFLKSQSGYDKFTRTIDSIMGDYRGDPKVSSLSSLQVNDFGKVALDLVSAMTDTKMFWEYRTLNKLFEMQSQILGKLAQAWWINRAIDLKYADVVKYAIAMGTGYAHLTFNEDMQDLDMVAEDARDVLPIRPGSLVSIQEAFGVIIRRERTVNYLRAMFPGKAAKIVADRDGTWRQVNQNNRVSQLMESLGLQSGFMTNLVASLANRPKAASMKVPTCDQYIIYVKDESINRTGYDVVMGDPERNWSYIVKNGEALYPNKRCIVCTHTAVLYDGPNIYWHGLFPVPKLTIDPWPWSWLGKSPLKDLLPIDDELRKSWRTVADHNERVARPGLVADKNSMSQAAVKAIDTRRSGMKLRHNPIAGKGVEIIHEPPLDPSIPLTITALTEKMQELSGTVDLKNMNNLNQIPSSETIEKMIESMSPAVRLRSRVQECFMREFAMITAMNMFQFRTVAERIAILGPAQGLTFEDFDYDPQTLIPDMLNMGLAAADGKPLPRYIRAKKFITYFSFQIAPGSLLEASNVTRKLLYIQLMRAGLIDHWTLLEILGVPNVGNPPDGANTITERLQAEQQMGIGAAVSPVGRHASAQQMPTMKSGGNISESG